MRYVVLGLLCVAMVLPAAGQTSDPICLRRPSSTDAAKRQFAYCIINKLPDSRYARAYAYHVIASLPKASTTAGAELDTEIQVIRDFIDDPIKIGVDSLAPIAELEVFLRQFLTHTGILGDVTNAAVGASLPTLTLAGGVSAGLRSQGDVWSQLAAFLVERAEQEAATAFINKLSNELVGSELGELVKALLPQTYVLLKTRERVTIAEMGPLWQTAFRQDLRQLPARILDQEDEYRILRLLVARSMDTTATSQPVKDVVNKGRVTLGAGRLINDAAAALQKGNDPMLVLSNLPHYAEPLFTALAAQTSHPGSIRHIRAGVDFFAELSEDFYFQGELPVDSIRQVPPYILTARSIARAPEQQRKLYLYLLALDDSTERLREMVRQSEKYYAVFSPFAREIVSEMEKVQVQLAEARAADADLSRAARYQLYLESTLDVASVALLFLDPSEVEDRARTIGSASEVADDLDEWLTASDGMAVASIRKQLKKGLEAADHLIELQKAIAAGSYPAMWQQASAFYFEATGETVPSRFAQAMTFAVNVAVAEDAADVAHAVRATADPVGGYKAKRKDSSTVSVTSYFGLGGGFEGLQSTHLNDVRTGFVTGVHAPLGVEYTWGKGAGSNGVMLSLFDFGSLIQYRVTGNSPMLTDSEGVEKSAEVKKLPDIGFRQVFSPGLFYVHGFGGPVTLGVGVQVNPDLRSVEASGATAEASAVRGSVFVAIDLTLFKF